MVRIILGASRPSADSPTAFGALGADDARRVFSLAPGEAQQYLAVYAISWGDSITAAAYEGAGGGAGVAGAEAEPLDTVTYTFEKPEGAVEGQPYEAWIHFTWDGEKLSAELRNPNAKHAASHRGAAPLAVEGLRPSSPILGVDYDADGNAYVVTIAPASVTKYDPNGKILRQWGSNGDGDKEFMGPAGIAVDRANGYVYVSDTGNECIKKFDLDGNFLDKWGEDIENFSPFDLAWNPADDSLFVSDWDPVRYKGKGYVRQLLFDEKGKVADERIYKVWNITGGMIVPGGLR